jgi:gamma-glutamylcyclotransferase (GGCT)/AIG2-like uncharacterized protein YtfP
MNPLLFVYGSLLAAAGHPKGARLRQEALLVGPASMAGRLYRVSWYPAVRPAESADDRVHGEVYRLADPARALGWLDEYEGISPGAQSVAAADAYERAERDVRLANGDTLRAWVYLYRRTLPEDGFIASGHWHG